MKTLKILGGLFSMVLAAGCGNAVLGVQLQLSTKACGADASRDPVAGVTQLRIRITGDNLQPITVTAPYSQGNAQVPNVPVGTNRRITVEALRGSSVRARADSGPFDASGSSDIKLGLQLRVVDAFTPSADASAACTSMTTARAGHAMALLPDGRVLITGGYNIANGLVVPHSDAEIYDPSTGRFTQVSAARYQRSGHSALPVQVSASETGVLVLGGEGPDQSGTGAPVKPLELFSNAGWSIIQPNGTSPAREHQAAALDLRTGYAVVAGGQSGPDFTATPTIFNSISYYDPKSGAVRDSTLVLPRAVTDAVAVARVNAVHGTGQAQGGIVFVGGRDSALKPSAQVSAVVWRDSSFDFDADSRFSVAQIQLPTPRYKHAAVVLADDTVLTVGGLTAAADSNDYSAPTDAITILDPNAEAAYDVTSAKLVQPRADACAAVLEDGSVLVAGGAWKDGAGLHSGRVVDLIAPHGRDTTVRNLQGPEAGGDWALAQGRYRAACIRLRNGSVLVTGGIQIAADGTRTILSGAEIYTPVGPAAQ